MNCEGIPLAIPHFASAIILSQRFATIHSVMSRLRLQRVVY